MNILRLTLVGGEEYVDAVGIGVLEVPVLSGGADVHQHGDPIDRPTGPTNGAVRSTAAFLQADREDNRATATALAT